MLIIVLCQDNQECCVDRNLNNVVGALEWATNNKFIKNVFSGELFKTIEVFTRVAGTPKSRPLCGESQILQLQVIFPTQFDDLQVMLSVYPLFYLLVSICGLVAFIIMII